MMYWWEEERFLTQKDKEAIARAKVQRWEDIDENSAETEIGRLRLRQIVMRKYHTDEFNADML